MYKPLPVGAVIREEEIPSHPHHSQRFTTLKNTRRRLQVGPSCTNDIHARIGSKLADSPTCWWPPQRSEWGTGSTAAPG